MEKVINLRWRYGSAGNAPVSCPSSRGQWSHFFAFQIVITSGEPCEHTPLSFNIFSVALTISALGKTIDSPLVRVSNSKATNSSR
jgi:hypothetical protein